MKKFLAVVLLFSCLAFAATPVCGEGGGDWVVTGEENCSGGIHVSSLTIQDGATLTLENADLRVDDEGMISAEPGSSLFIHDSTVDVYVPAPQIPTDERFYFVVDGADFEFVGSELRHCGKQSINDEKWGLLVTQSHSTLIENSVFESNYYPLRIHDSLDNAELSVIDNNFSFNEYYVGLMNLNEVNFSFNNVSYISSEAYLLSLSYVNESEFTGNVLNSEFFGMTIGYSSGNKFSENTAIVADPLTYYAFYLHSTSLNNKVWGNVFNSASLSSCVGLSVVGGAITERAVFPFGVQSVTLASVDTPGFEVEGGVIEGSTLTNVKLKEGNYEFVNSQVANVDFEEPIVIGENSRLYNCTFGLENAEAEQCYCIGGECGGCAIPTGNYSNNLASYAVKMQGSNPALYDSTIIAVNGTAVLIDGADNAILWDNVIEATQGVFVNQSTNVVISNANFTPLDFSVNWALRESFVGDEAYHECTAAVGLSAERKLSFAEGAGGGLEYLDCGMRSECNMLYYMGAGMYTFPVCGCYATPPTGCTNDNIILNYKQCEPGKYCYGNWVEFNPWVPFPGNQWLSQPNYINELGEFTSTGSHICSGFEPQVTVESCSAQGYPEANCLAPPQSGKVAVGAYRCQANPNKYCYVEPQGGYTSCENQGFGLFAVCESSAPDGYESCGGTECLQGKYCFKPIDYPSCVLGQGFPVGTLCASVAPKGYSLCPGSEDCAFDAECYCEDPVYATCASQGFENAVCVVEKPTGWVLCPGSVACGEDKECYYNPLQQVGPCIDPGDCVAAISEMCVVESVPFIVVDGSAMVEVKNSIFDSGVVIDVEEDSSLVSLNYNEFNGQALVFLRGDYGEFNGNEFTSALIHQYVGIDVLGNNNSIRSLELTDSKGIVFWGNGNELVEASLGGSGIEYEGADYNVVERGRGNYAYGVNSPNAGLLLKPLVVQGLGLGVEWSDSFYAFSSFNGLRLEDDAFARYLSGSTGATNTIDDVNFVDFDSELQREWNVSVTVSEQAGGVINNPLVIPGASVSFASANGELTGEGVADENGFVVFNVTQGVFDKDMQSAVPAGWEAFSFDGVDYNPYSFSASAEGFDEGVWEGDVESDGGLAIGLISGSYLTCAEQNYQAAVCAAVAPSGYAVCGGTPYSGQECGQGLICYCPTFVQPTVEPTVQPSPQQGVFLVAVEPNRAQLPGLIPIKVSLQYEGVPLCVDEAMVVTVTGAGAEIPADFVSCDSAYGLHEFEVELHAPGLYLVQVSAVSNEFEGAATAETEFQVIAQQPVATPDLSVVLALLAGIAAFYAVTKQTPGVCDARNPRRRCRGKQ